MACEYKTCWDVLPTSYLDRSSHSSTEISLSSSVLSQSHTVCQFKWNTETQKQRTLASIDVARNMVKHKLE